MSDAKDYAEIIAAEALNSVEIKRDTYDPAPNEVWETPALMKWAKSEVKDGAPVPMLVLTVSAADDYRPDVGDIVRIIDDPVEGRKFKVTFVDQGGSIGATPTRFKLGCS